MQVRINKQIQASALRVIGPDGRQCGILTLAEALKLARSFGMDMVEIAPTATPPIARIIDYAKFREEQLRRNTNN